MTETFKKVETWLEENSFLDALKKEDLIRTGQSYGNNVVVRIDTRNGEIAGSTTYQNTYQDTDSFWITLASHPEIEMDDNAICEGAEMTASVSKEKLLEIIDEEQIEEALENNLIFKKNGNFKISWWEVEDAFSITAEDFIINFLEEDWEEWKDDYLEYYCGENVGADWIEKIKEFYADLEKQKTEREY